MQEAEANKIFLGQRMQGFKSDAERSPQRFLATRIFLLVPAFFFWKAINKVGSI